jgi:hypothetical protein
MAAKLKKNQSKPYEFNSGQSSNQPKIDASGSKPKPKQPASVNLRYFHRSNECFSKWQKKELIAFSGFVEKMATKTASQVTSVTQTCHSHMGTTNKRLPVTVSKDVRMYSLDVGPKGRVHGFFSQGTFFMVWIDRAGKILGH